MKTIRFIESRGLQMSTNSRGLTLDDEGQVSLYKLEYLESILSLLVSVKNRIKDMASYLNNFLELRLGNTVVGFLKTIV